jgi:ATP-dependent DNA ligase
MANLREIDHYPGKLSEDGMRYEFKPLVYYTARTKNNVRQSNKWQIFVEVLNINGLPVPISHPAWIHPANWPPQFYARFFVESGALNGAIRKSEVTTIRVGKNLGKRNETTPYSQALMEANHKHDKQGRNREFSDETNDQISYIPPQKLANFDVRKLISFADLYIEPKYNGVHCLAYLNIPSEGGVRLQSSQNKDYYGDDLKKLLSAILPPDTMIDGELWAPGLALQNITSAAKNPVTRGAGLSYVIYDVYLPHKPEASQYERKQILIQLMSRANFNRLNQRTSAGVDLLIMAPIAKVNNLTEIQAAFDDFVAHGYEGAVIRDYRLPYAPAYGGHRSANMKMKKIFDDEFEIVGFDQATQGKALGLIMFICKARDSDRTVAVTMSRSEEWRKTEYEKCATQNGYFDETYKGHYLTVEYRDITVDGLPSHAVGKVFDFEKE